MTAQVAPAIPLTMAMLESWTGGRSGGTSEMFRKAETETEVPEGLMVQRGGAETCSTSLSGASTEGLWGRQVSWRQGAGQGHALPWGSTVLSTLSGGSSPA